MPFKVAFYIVQNTCQDMGDEEKRKRSTMNVRGKYYFLKTLEKLCNFTCFPCFHPLPHFLDSSCADMRNILQQLV